MQSGARVLDSFVRPELTLLGRRVSSFHVCGTTGLVFGPLLGMVLVTRLGLSPQVLGILVTVSFATFVLLALATKVVTGEERLIYYHHEIAILVACALTLRLLGRPVLPYLDVVLLGVGLFLACGRVGCLMVGCCHGRPCSWGVAYRAEHARAGFERHLVGVRLFPIQMVEALFVFGVVAVGSVLVWKGRPPGEALAVYVFAYGLARFLFELARGDADRPYLAGFSEAQWTSLVLMAGGVGVGLAGDLPFYPLQVGATAGVVLTMAGLALKRRLDPTRRYELFHPRHVSEVAAALQEMQVPEEPSEAVTVDLLETSRGLRVSRGRVDGADHYCLSCAGPPMGAAIAELAATLIERLRPGEGARELIRGTAGVFHVLRRPDLRPPAHPMPRQGLR